MLEILSEKHPIKMWLNSNGDGPDIESEALQQIRNVANLPFIHHHVAVMPDAHAGKGATIGTVIATKGAIIPAAVGVDIGCGMSALLLPFKIDQLGGDARLKELRHSIERSVPVGRHSNTDTSIRVMQACTRLLNLRHTFMDPNYCNFIYQLGTLGGGNHFIEICHDRHQNAWILLHTGSRHIGKTLAEVHINQAKQLMKAYFITPPDPDLAYLAQSTPEFENYKDDLLWCQAYARENRTEIMLRILKDISHHLYREDRRIEIVLHIDCHHNYTQMEHHYDQNVWVTRKGAVSAQFNEYGIIPGSMGQKSYIVQGLGNAPSFHSCSHGAGRRMSRTKARHTYTEQDLAAQTQGVECRKDKDIVDEIPAAYKDIDQVMANQLDLVQPIYELKQVICIKG